MRRNIEKQVGVIRSLAIYYGVPGRIRRLTDFYRPFIQPGDLCFDIGTHVGNRIAGWSRLGARIIAVEPQAHLIPWLRRFYGRSPHVTLLQAAIGSAEGTATLHSSRTNPTVATLSDSWLAAVSSDKSFASVNWNETETVPVTTLDNLIARYGLPVLVKIDVEGYESEVLRGLTVPVPVISFEYIPAAIDMAGFCIDRLAALGEYKFNWFTGETHRWVSPAWLTYSEMSRELEQLAAGRTSGDIFARLIAGTP